MSSLILDSTNFFLLLFFNISCAKIKLSTTDNTYGLCVVITILPFDSLIFLMIQSIRKCWVEGNKFNSGSSITNICFFLLSTYWLNTIHNGIIDWIPLEVWDSFTSLFSFIRYTVSPLLLNDTLISRMFISIFLYWILAFSYKLPKSFMQSGILAPAWSKENMLLENVEINNLSAGIYTGIHSS